MSTLKIISMGGNETIIEFTKEDLELTPALPGISLGHVVIFKDRLQEKLGLPPTNPRYKDGYIDRIHEVMITSQIMVALNKATMDKFGDAIDFKNIWICILHLLRDELKGSSFLVDLNTANVSIEE